MKRYAYTIITFGIIFVLVSINGSFASSKSSGSVDNNLTVSETTVNDKIDINSADEKQLINLPGIGPKMALRISEYREVNGPFKSVDDLLNVKGIGPKVLEKIKPFAKVS